MDYNELLDDARTHIEKLPAGQIFFVKDLFYGTGWKELERGESWVSEGISKKLF